MTHTYFHFDGFEVQADAQDEARWALQSGTVPSIETTTVSYGRAAARWSMAAASGYVRLYSERQTDGTFLDDATPEEGVWMSFHLNITTLPTAGLFYYLCSTGDVSVNPRAALRINGNTGFLEVFSDGAGTWTAGSVALSTATWYVVSFYSFQGTAPQGIVRLRDTGASVDSKTHGTALGAGTIPRYIDLGPYTTSTGNCVFDNWVVESSPTAGSIDDPVNDLTTKYACGLLLPDGAGSYDVWSGTFADVDDVPHDDDTTRRVMTGAAGAGKAFTNALTAGASLAAQVGTIKATMHFAFLRAASANQSVAIRLRSASTDADSTDTTDIPTAAYTCRQLLRTTDPATSSSWTASGVDSAEVGAIRNASDSGDNYCTLCGMELLYTITTVDRTPRIAYVFDAWDQQQRVYDEQGRAVPYNEIRSNRWMRLTSIETPTAYQPTTFIQERAVVNLEGVVYTQELGQPPRLELMGAPDDFLPNLLRRIQDSGGGV